MKHVKRENKDRSASKLRFTGLISEFICAVQVSWKRPRIPRGKLVLSRMGAKAIPLIADLKKNKKEPEQTADRLYSGA